jgi:phenylacetate-CoA ligase
MNMKSSIFRMYQLSRGRKIFDILSDLEESQWLSSSEIEMIQWNKIKALLDHAYNYVPFYKRIFDELNLAPDDINNKEDFRKLPILTKDDIENNILKITATNYNRHDIRKDSTGGSTGQTLEFYTDLNRSDVLTAFLIRSNRINGLDIGDKHAYLWGSTFDISLQNKLTNKLYNSMYGCDLFLSTYDLSEKQMYKYAKQLQKYKPKVIVGYASPLHFFANFLSRNNIKGINPKSIISSAEVLYDYQRELIEAVFDCKVFNRYGCREFGIIAQECSEHSGLHINDEHVYIEFLKENNEPSKKGEKGELIVTDLDNYGMPFIRYKIGDMGTPSDKKCKCGRGTSVMGSIEGRTFDVIIGTNGRALGGTFWTLLFRTAIKGIKQFQVTQESKDKLKIKIVVNEDFDNNSVYYLTNKIHEHCGNDMEINFEIVDKIPLTKSGKFRFVISSNAPFEEH